LKSKAIITDLVALQLCNRRCQGNCFVPHSLWGRPHISPWIRSWCDHP